MIATSMLDPALSSRLCLMLVHSLWQVPLLATFVWCCERLLRWSVERRYLMHVAAMVIALVLLPVTFAVVDGGTLGEAAIARPVGVDEPQQVSLAPIDVAAPLRVDVEASATVSGPVKPQAVDHVELAGRQMDVAAVESPADASVWTLLAPWLAACYVAGVGLMLLRLMFGVWAAQRLVARSRPVSDSAIQLSLEPLARRLSVRSRPVVAYSEQVLVPRIVGLLRPVILLPTSAMTGLAPEQVEMVLAHELTHLRRHDIWINLLQRVAEAVLFFNPLLWYLSHRINVLREYCCDDAVCRATSENADDVRCRYAAALLQVAELSRSSAALGRRGRTPDAAELTTLAASGRSPSQLRRRIARLVGEPLREPLHLSRGGLLTLLAVAVAVILSSSLWPVIAQTDEAGAAEQREPTSDDAEPRRAVDSRVEVIAIGTHNEQPQRWWDADGTIIETPPFEWTEGHDVSGDERQWRRVVIRVRDLAEGEEVRWEISGEPDSWGATVTIDGKKNPRGYYTRQFVVPEGRRDLGLRVGIASGEWKTVAAFGTHNTIEVKDAEPSFISAGTFEEEGGTTLFLTHDAFKPNFRVVALDKEGRTHDSGYRGGLSTGTKIYQSRITFRGLSREQIDHFKFQTRPYEWTEFDGLPLEPRGGDAIRDDNGRVFRLNVVGPDGARIANAQVKLRTSPTITAEQIRRGTFVRQESFGSFTTMFATTDDEGRLDVAFPDRPVLFRVSIEHAGYAPYWTEWDSRQHPHVIPIPLNFTAQLEEGWSVGGVVVDEHGDSVEGVTVRPTITPKMRPGEATDVSAGTPVETNADGAWLYESVPGSMSDVHVEVTHPDFQPLRRRLSRDVFEVKPDALPVARIALNRGLTVTGKVTGESGAPIAGALVRTKLLNDIREATTNEAGEYRLTGCELGKAQIVVSGKGQAIEMQEVQFGPGMEPVNFSMQPGRTIRIRVVDEQGTGIPEARIFFQRWRGHHAYFAFQHVNQFADENGLWEWSEAPVDEFQADICRPDGMQLSRQPLIARDEEYVFTPPAALIVSGKVVDANTGERVKNFRVIPGLRNIDPEIGFDWLRGDSYLATDQTYRIRFSHTAVSGIHVVRIEADGYKIARSRDIKFDEEDVEIDFRLEPKEDSTAASQSNDAAVEFPVVIAEHVLLLDGREVITWDELEEKIAGLPDPSLAYPRFYVTRGAREAGLDKPAKEQIWRLRKDYKLSGHSEGSLWPRSDLRYDRITSADDLTPDQSRRIDGRVVDVDGNAVEGAEVIVITPIDESISYRSYHIALVNGRVRNRLEHVMSVTDAEGRFTIYPPKDTSFTLVTLHPGGGFALTSPEALARSEETVRLLQWASLAVTFTDDEKSQQAALSTRLQEADGRPEVVFNQYWSDLAARDAAHSGTFRFTHVPPIFRTSVSRSFPDKEGVSFSVLDVSVSLLPGERRDLHLGPMSDQQRQRLQSIRQRFN